MSISTPHYGAFPDHENNRLVLRVTEVDTDTSVHIKLSEHEVEELVAELQDIADDLFGLGDCYEEATK